MAVRKTSWTLEQTQSLETLNVFDSQHAIPAPNQKHLRLYGHLLCPFVERVRLVLSAQGLPYQDVEINLEKRTRWHYSMNGGFVPILETPSHAARMGTRKAFILESRIIMDYLDAEFKGIAKCGSLYDDDPLQRAHQEMLMVKGDQLASVLYVVLMTRATHEASMATLTKVLEFMNMQLQASPTDFFLGKQRYSMVDLYAFPFVSRLFYLKDSALHVMYEQLNLEDRYPSLFKWFKAIRACPELNDGKAIIPVSGFTYFLAELAPMPLGKKPPLRLPTKL